jgi:uncharacterized integral membrane protein
MRRREEFDPGENGDGNGDGNGPEPVPRSGIAPRWIVAGVGALLLIIFALQNAERVDVDFLVFDAQVRVVVVIVVSALLGFAVGWLVGRPSRMQRKAMRKGMD